MTRILHIAEECAWTARTADRYSIPSLESEGFIHASLPHQVVDVATRYYGGRTDLVLLLIDEDALDVEVRYEDLTGEGQAYPHIFGSINLDAVVQAVDFASDRQGRFALPSEVARHIDA